MNFSDLIYTKNLTAECLDVQQLVPYYLMASYLYGVCDESIMSDFEFDKLGRRLNIEWDMISHPHKSIICRDSCDFTGHSDLEKKYPLMVVGAARSYWRELEKRSLCGQ